MRFPPPKLSLRERIIRQQHNNASFLQSVRPVIIQPKTSVPQPKPAISKPIERLRSQASVLSRRPPTAPAAYKPLPAPKCLQPKSAGNSGTSTHPKAPMVYRPQGLPKVLQTKNSSTEKGHHSADKRTGTAVQSKAFAPAKSGKPDQTKIIQPYLIIPEYKVAGKKDDLIRPINLKNPGAVIHGKGAFSAQEKNKKKKKQGFLNNTGTEANIVNLDRVSLRVSDDFKMAIENSDLKSRQPKNFYASDEVFQNSKSRLQNTKSKFNLARTGKSLRIYFAEKEFTDLKQIVPRKVVDGKSEILKDPLKMKARQNCGDIASDITGFKTDSVMQTPTAKLIKTHLEANIVGEIQQAIAQHLSILFNTSTGDHIGDIEKIPLVSDDPIGDRNKKDALVNKIAKEYVNALNSMDQDKVEEELKRLKINRFANPSVGESYVIATMAGPGNNGQITDYMAKKTFTPNWMYHFGGVVAKSGNDTVTLENYARGSSETLGDPGQDPRWYFQMYSTNKGQSFHEANLALGGYANAVTMTLKKPPVKVVVKAKPKQVGPPQKSYNGKVIGTLLLTTIIVSILALKYYDKI